MNGCQREAVTGDGAEVQEPMGFHVLCQGELLLGARWLPAWCLEGCVHSLGHLPLHQQPLERSKSLSWMYWTLCLSLGVLHPRGLPDLWWCCSLLGISCFLFVLVNPGQLSLGKVRGDRSCRIEHYCWSRTSLSHLHWDFWRGKDVWLVSMSGREWILGTQWI